MRRSQIRISNSIISLIEVCYEVFWRGIQKFNSRRIKKTPKFVFETQFFWGLVCILHFIWYQNILWKVHSWKHRCIVIIKWQLSTLVFSTDFSHLWKSRVLLATNCKRWRYILWKYRLIKILLHIRKYFAHFARIHLL